MSVKPPLKTKKTLLAPHLRADVAQSKAVSPAPRTITFPPSWGKSLEDLQAQSPFLLASDTLGRNDLDV